MMVGLSPSATVWWQGVEGPANAAYQRWLVANPLGRLGLDPSTVVGEFDSHLYGRVESRAVSLLLAAVPQSIRDDVVTNRWLASTSILFRVLCLFQPGGSSERSHLLAQLVNPSTCKTFGEAVKGLRTWQQGLQRAGEIHATLPDSSLLLRGVDSATATLLAAHPMIGFRVNAFRHQLAIDYNPTVQSVVQLVRLIQAECEAASITVETGTDKRARTAVLQANREPPVTKAPPTPPPPPNPQVAAANAVQGEDKGKGKGKAKGEEGCIKFGDATGCRFGDACRFKHDRAKARKEGRCLACGQKDHFRPDCPMVAPENRLVQDGSPSSEGTPKTSGPGGKGGKPKGKAKAVAQAKGITEDQGSGERSGAGVSSVATDTSAGQEALIAEATKLLKGVTLKPLRLESGPVMTGSVDLSGVDASWLFSVAGVSDCNFALVDSGATNALRPARDSELEAGRVIRVDLASGTTELRINKFGTLLHAGQCQVILPAAYLVDLGFTITWKRKGCVIKHPRKGRLDVRVVKGCPLIPREVGLGLLNEYEELRESEPKAAKVRECGGLDRVAKEDLRGWLRDRLKGQNVQAGSLSEEDQLLYLGSLFPTLPLGVLEKACLETGLPAVSDWSTFPWNRRLRRSVGRAKEGSVMVNSTGKPSGWKGLGRVLSVGGREAGLGSDGIFRQMLLWARTGVFGGFVYELPPMAEVWSEGGLTEEFMAHLRFLLLFGISQAVRDVNAGPRAGAAGGGPERKVGDDEVPEDLEDPGQIALWALRRAAAGLEESRGVYGQSVFFVCETPVLSPSTRCEKPDHVQWEKALLGFQEVYGLCRACFDQGCLGASESCATELLTSSWFLFEALQGHRVSPGSPQYLELLGLLTFGHGTPGRDGWTVPLSRVIQNAWGRWKSELAASVEVEERKIFLKKMCSREDYARHVANDHSPYLRGCPICIQAQGRRRSHWRSSFPTVHSASFDIAGPFVAGKSFDPVASGRDRGGGYRYFLACSYAVPEGYVPLSPEGSGGESKEGAAAEVVDEASPVDQPELFPELFGTVEDGFLEDGVVKAVTHRVKGKRPEEPEGGVGPIDWGEGETPSFSGKKRVLFIGTPLRSKTGKEVLGQVQCLVNKLEAYGLPVQRYHADRAKELRSTALVSWIRERGIHGSWTPGECPAGNHGELAIQNLKGGIRRLLLASKVDREFWPLALLHASARNWAGFSTLLGVPHVPILPFGTPVEARKRTRSGYQFQWVSRTTRGSYLGPAPHTSGGHLVLVKESPDGPQTILLTGTVFPVREQSAAVVKPKFRLTAKRSPTDSGFAVRVAAATAVGQEGNFSAESRLPPGGESSLGFFQSSLGFFQDSGWLFGVGDSFVGGDLDDPSFGGGFEPGPSWDPSGPLRDSELGEGRFQVEDLDEVVGVRVAQKGNASEIRQKVDAGMFSNSDCLELLRMYFPELPTARRPMLHCQGRAVLCGMYSLGGFHGVSRCARDNPWVVRYLNGFIGSVCPGHLWTALYIFLTTPLCRCTVT